MSSVIQRITESIQLRLRPVAISNLAGIGKVGIVRPFRLIDRDDAVVVQKASDKPIPALDRPGNPPGKAYEATFNLNCFIETQESETKFSELCDETASEIIRRITTPDAPTWHSFGGLAINARFDGPKDLPTDTGKKGGITVPLIVQYRVSENDPSIVR